MGGFLVTGLGIFDCRFLIFLFLRQFPNRELSS